MDHERNLLSIEVIDKIIDLRNSGRMDDHELSQEYNISEAEIRSFVQRKEKNKPIFCKEDYTLMYEMLKENDKISNKNLLAAVNQNRKINFSESKIKKEKGKIMTRLELEKVFDTSLDMEQEYERKKIKILIQAGMSDDDIVKECEENNFQVIRTLLEIQTIRDRLREGVTPPAEQSEEFRYPYGADAPAAQPVAEYVPVAEPDINQPGPSGLQGVFRAEPGTIRQENVPAIMPEPHTQPWIENNRKLKKINIRLKKLEKRMDKIEARVDKLEARMDKLEHLHSESTASGSEQQPKGHKRQMLSQKGAPSPKRGKHNK